MTHMQALVGELPLSSNLENVELEAGSIPAKWLLSGEPQTRSRFLGRSKDGLGYAMLWECGAVSYKWYYTRDEAYIVLSGEGFMTDDQGVEHRYAAGDVAFFPAGTSSTWRHPHHFRKVAVLKDSIWRPLALAGKAWNKLREIAGLSGSSPF
jgi:uncharacterized cupin superfamily protein